MATTGKQPVSNTLKGKIKHIVEAPPYQIVTIELDRDTPPEITVAYIPVPGAPKLAVCAPDANAPHVLAATASGTSGSGDGNGGNGSGQVTVTIPVPNAVISSGN